MKISIVKRNYINKDGQSPLYLFVNKSGKRTRTFLDIYVPSKKWNAKTETVIGKSKEIDDLNLIINNIKSKITSIKTFYRLSEKYLTIEKFMEEFQNENTRADFIGFYKYQLDAQKGVLEFNTHRKQLSILRKLKKFRNTIYFSDIDMKFINDYKSYLRNELKNSQTTINSNIIILKKYLRLAVNAGIKMPLNLNEVKGGNTNGNRTNLNPEEVKKLISYYNSEFIRENHVLPLALFLFSCFTGVRLSDTLRLTRESVNDGSYVFTAKKTGKHQVLKLNKQAQLVFDSCKDMLEKKPTEQHINRKLKDIIHLVGIKKKVTFHVARHTFATNLLRAGARVEVLQKLLNHSSIKETMIYVHIIEQEKNTEIMLMDNIFN